jgi:hypothetical protein
MNQWEIILHHGLEYLILLKCPYSPQKIYSFNEILMQISIVFFVEIEKKKDPKIHMES